MHHSFLLDKTMLLMFTYHIYTSSHQFIFKHTMKGTNKIGFTQNQHHRGVATIFFKASIKKQNFAPIYLQLHYGNEVFGNVYLSAGQH